MPELAQKAISSMYDGTHLSYADDYYKPYSEFADNLMQQEMNAGARMEVSAMIDTQLKVQQHSRNDIKSNMGTAERFDMDDARKLQRENFFFRLSYQSYGGKPTEDSFRTLTDPNKKVERREGESTSDFKGRLQQKNSDLTRVVREHERLDDEKLENAVLSKQIEDAVKAGEFEVGPDIQDKVDLIKWNGMSMSMKLSHADAAVTHLNRQKAK